MRLPTSLIFYLVLYAQSASALVNADSSFKTNDVVRLTWKDNVSICTGFFIKENLIITAAHCFYHYKTSELVSIDSINNQKGKVDISIVKFHIHPLYEKNKSATHDIAAIEVEDYTAFEGKFKELNASDDLNSYTLFGAGKVNLDNKAYGYMKGKCRGVKLGKSFYCMGASSNDSKLYGSTVAPNDSGCPILDNDGGLVAIGTKTTVSWTYGYPVPAISTGVLIKDKENYSFLKKIINSMTTR